MLLADGGSIRPAKSPAPPSPPPAPTPQQGQGFDAALKKAQSDRAAADGKPNARRGDEIAHQAKQGDSLWSIAQEYRAPYARVLEANRQFRDPNQIRPGQVVFVPNPDPRVINTRQAVANATRQTNRWPTSRNLRTIPIPHRRSASLPRWSCRTPR